MITWLLVVNITIAIAILVLGLVAVIRNSKVLLHRLFLVFTFSLAAWIISNYFSNLTTLSYGNALYANRLTLFFPGIIAISMLMFIATLTNSKLYQKTRNVLLLFSGFVTLAALTSYVVKSVAVQENVFAIQFGPLANLYFGVLLINLSLAFAALFHGIRHTHGSERDRLVIIFWSILTTVLITIATNVALPLFTNSFVWTNIGPISVVVMAAGFYYSIAKHRLFDIRLVIARAAGYVLSVMALALVYGLLVFGLMQAFLSVRVPFYFELLISIGSGLAALSFQSFKRVFDRATNRLFYQDAYDPQELFNEYNKTLVSTIDLDVLLKRVTHVVTAYIKADYCLVAVVDSKDKSFRIINSARKTIAPADIEVAKHIVSHVKHSTLVVDDMPADLAKLKTIMQKYDVAVTVRLAANAHDVEGGLGYLVLGQKKTGNAYTHQDIKTIETLANELFIALQNALRFEEIERFNETLQQKVNAATRQLRETNQKLKDLNETKDDFIGMASHQLRTPLTSVKGYLSLVIDEDAGKINETQKKLLTQAFISSQRMVYLIADLLNVSRLRTGKFVIEASPTNIATMINDELSQLREMASSRNVELNFEPPVDFPTLPLDETKTRQVIMNFIDNAIYYTPAGGKVTVELNDLPSSVELRVIDNGIGVPKEERHHLFTKFYRAKNAQRARPDGTGLGLFMAKKVIVAQGGAIIFDSIEGQGSTFGFSFPKDLKAPAKEAVLAQSSDA